MPVGSGASRCRACGASILWAETLNGRRMPLDPEPREDGNVMVVDGIATVLPGDVERIPPLYVSHFVTCSDASRFRKSKKPGPGSRSK